MADLHSKILDAPPPPRVQILSISCSFWEILAKSYVGASPLGSWRPHLREILDPPLLKDYKKMRMQSAISPTCLLAPLTLYGHVMGNLRDFRKKFLKFPVKVP